MNDNRPLVVIFRLISKPIGGVQRVLATVLPHLVEEFRLVFIDPYNDPDFAATMRQAGLEVVSLGRAPNPRRIGGNGSLWRPFFLLRRAPWLLPIMWRFRRWAARENPDVVYFTELPPARVFGRLIAHRNVGLVYHEHGITSPNDVGRRTARFLSRRFARVLAVSKIMARFLVEAGTDPDKVHVVYNAVDAAAIRQRAELPPKPLPHKPPHSVVFVHIGELTWHKKAQHLSIGALARLPRETQTQLWICGDIPDTGDRAYLDQLKQQVTELDLLDRVHFLGWRDDVPSIVKASDVCVLPSRDHSESFGMVLAEAMAQGKPCIGSNMGGIPEVIDDRVTGLVCEPTEESLAEAMTQMLESPHMRQSMGEAGRLRVESAFSLPRQVAEFADAFRCAAAQGNRSPRAEGV